MNQIKRKLRSRRGASITFALLIFLVCAMVSSVVIVAATTAAGHMSSQAEMDERYYAVAAATQWIREKMEGEDFEGVPIKVTKSGSGASVELVNGNEDDVIDEMLESVTKQLVLGVDSPYSKFKDSYSPPEEDNVRGISCSISQSPITSNLLTFVVSATGGQNSKSGAYTLEVTFAPNRRLTGTKDVEEVTWRLNSIKKQSAANKQKSGNEAGEGGTP